MNALIHKRRINGFQKSNRYVAIIKYILALPWLFVVLEAPLLYSTCVPTGGPLFGSYKHTKFIPNTMLIYLFLFFLFLFFYSWCDILTVLPTKYM